MEGVLAALDKDKYPVPDPYPYEEARRLFRGALHYHSAVEDRPHRLARSAASVRPFQRDDTGGERGQLLP